MQHMQEGRPVSHETPDLVFILLIFDDNVFDSIFYL